MWGSKQLIPSKFSNKSILAEAGVVTPLCFNVWIRRCTSCFISDSKKEDYKKYQYTFNHYKSSLHTTVASQNGSLFPVPFLSTFHHKKHLLMEVPTWGQLQGQILTLKNFQAMLLSVHLCFPDTIRRRKFTSKMMAILMNKQLSSIPKIWLSACS